MAGPGLPGSQTGSGGVAATGGTGAGTGGAGSGGSSVGGGGTADAGATGGTVGSGKCGGGTAQASDITINEASLQQQISGFGVSSAWAGSYRNASDADYLWSTTKGAGLSLLRIRYGDGLAIAKSAVSYGVRVWMTPWGMGNNGSPGGPYTTTQSNPNGCTGSMPVLSDATGWANALVSYVQNLKNQGVPLYAVSAENEPDSCGINQTTSYSDVQLATWITTLGPAMKPLGIKVMGPETMNACGFSKYFTAIKNNAAAWDAVDIFASHEYGCGTLPVQTSISAANKEYWQTEVDTGKASSDPTGDGIASALLMATTMHNDLTKPNLNAWHLWWVYNASGNGGCLYDTTTNVWTKRLWVMGNYSRFVRPGWKRVGTSGTPPSGVLVSAYINPENSSLSIVAINSNTSAKDLSFYLSGEAPCSLTPYETSASKDLGQGAALSVSQARVTVTLAAQSVTTLVGTP
jgi:glucuronoarabinoxylan endo-1,4-beta-xylanase